MFLVEGTLGTNVCSALSDNKSSDIRAGTLLSNALR
jgi:hypothetical protein